MAASSSHRTALKARYSVLPHSLGQPPLSINFWAVWDFKTCKINYSTSPWVGIERGLKLMAAYFSAWRVRGGLSPGYKRMRSELSSGMLADAVGIFTYVYKYESTLDAGCVEPCVCVPVNERACVCVRG